MNEVKEFFDKIACEWTNDNDLDFIKKLLNHVNIKKQDDVLDVGCGKGVITHLLYEFSLKQVDAIDISSEMIKCTKNDCACNYICGDYITYDFNKKYDVVVVFNAYPHFLEKEKFAKKTYEVLKKDGKIVIMHDMSRLMLEKHHSGCAKNISCVLKDPDNEYKPFSDRFAKVFSIDDDKSYMLIMQKL